jgi:hypothetical protein
MFLTPQWISIQRPDKATLTHRKALLSGSPSKEVPFSLPFVAFRDARFRTLLPTRMKQYKWVLVLIALWRFSPKHVIETNNTRIRFNAFPVDLMYYFLDSVWMEKLICTCWSMSPPLVKKEKHLPLDIS